LSSTNDPISEDVYEEPESQVRLGTFRVLLCDRKEEERWVCEMRFAIPRTVDTNVEEALDEDDDEDDDDREYGGGSYGATPRFCTCAGEALTLLALVILSKGSTRVLAYWKDMSGAKAAQASSSSKRRS
jgi:hypothetical protein